MDDWFQGWGQAYDSGSLYTLGHGSLHCSPLGKLWLFQTETSNLILSMINPTIAIDSPQDFFFF